jgi:hypothetical protein
MTSLRVISMVTGGERLAEGGTTPLMVAQFVEGVLGVEGEKVAVPQDNEE